MINAYSNNHSDKSSNEKDNMVNVSVRRRFSIGSGAISLTLDDNPIEEDFESENEEQKFNFSCNSTQSFSNKTSPRFKQ